MTLVHVPSVRPASAQTEEATLHEPLRFELDDPALAESLRRELSPFHADIVRDDGGFEVRVELITANPEARITAALNVVDDWLARTSTPAVRVRLDGRVYTLTRPV